MSFIKTGLFGMGKMGALYALDPVMTQQVEYVSHLQVIEAHPAFELVVGIDPSETVRQQVEQHWPRVRTAASVESAENLDAIELAVLATPPQARIEIIRALPNVKTVFVEKPLGLDVESSRAFLDECAERGIQVQVNFWRRADTLFNRLAKGELRELIGETQAVMGIYGNGLHNNAAHIIDFVDMLCDDIVAVTANGPTKVRARNPILNDVDQSFSLITETGVTASFIAVDFDHYREVSFDFWGTAGRLEMIQESAVIRVSGLAENRGESGVKEVASDRYCVIETEVGTALWEMYEDLHQVICHGAALISPGINALKCELVLDAILTSAKTGCVVTVPHLSTKD